MGGEWSGEFLAKSETSVLGAYTEAVWRSGLVRMKPNGRGVGRSEATSVKLVFIHRTGMNGGNINTRSCAMILCETESEEIACTPQHRWAVQEIERVVLYRLENRNKCHVWNMSPSSRQKKKKTLIRISIRTAAMVGWPLMVKTSPVRVKFWVTQRPVVVSVA